MLPVVLCYTLGVNQAVGIAVLVIYCGCGIIRLAWFNMLENAAPSRRPESAITAGLPITFISAILPLFYLLRVWLPDASVAVALHGMLLATACLYVVDIPVPVTKPAVGAGLMLLDIAAPGGLFPFGKMIGRARDEIQGSKRQRYHGESEAGLLLRLLYGTAAGRLLISPLARPAVSRLAGALAEHPLLRAGGAMGREAGAASTSHRLQGDALFLLQRVFSQGAAASQAPRRPRRDVLISPCDGKLLVCPIEADSPLCDQAQPLLAGKPARDEGLAARFEGGTLMIFRLNGGTDYHRYCYVANGRKTENVRLPGVLHSVNPVAVGPSPRIQGKRQGILSPGNGGLRHGPCDGGRRAAGGQNRNHHGACAVRKGMEKGYFEFGGLHHRPGAGEGPRRSGRRYSRQQPGRAGNARPPGRAGGRGGRAE